MRNGINDCDFSFSAFLRDRDGNPGRYRLGIKTLRHGGTESGKDPSSMLGCGGTPHFGLVPAPYIDRRGILPIAVASTVCASTHCKFYARTQKAFCFSKPLPRKVMENSLEA